MSYIIILNFLLRITFVHSIFRVRVHSVLQAKLHHFAIHMSYKLPTYMSGFILVIFNILYVN